MAFHHLFASSPASGDGDRTLSAERATDSQQLAVHQLANDQPPGVFADLEHFVEKVDLAKLPFHSCTRHPPQRGDVIYMKSRDQEMDRRVMLVTRMTKVSATCLTFCRHDGRRRAPEHHWNVTVKNAQPEQRRVVAATATSASLCISLLGGKLREGVFINLNEPWTVQFETTEISVIAEVPNDEFSRLSREAAKLYAVGMGLPWNDLSLAEPAVRVGSCESTEGRPSELLNSADQQPRRKRKTERANFDRERYERRNHRSSEGTRPKKGWFS